MPPSPSNHASPPPPAWYCLLALVALFLLPATRLPLPGVALPLPLFSPGEQLLIPLAVWALSMGLLPLWTRALLAPALWLAAAAGASILSGMTPGGLDLLLAWAARLLAPMIVFLPLLAVRVWRDRLFWTLAATLTVNAALVFFQIRTAGIPAGDAGLLALGGATTAQFAYGVLVAVALPLLAAWRGGDERTVAAGRNRALFTLLFTFLLPGLALSASFTVMALAAAAAGLSLAWAAWRRSAWIMGVFVCLLVVGAGGGESRRAEDAARRRLLVASAGADGAAYARSLAVFTESPYTGAGMAAFLTEEPSAGGAPAPWYAFLLGGTGLTGLAGWVAMLAGVAARCLRNNENGRNDGGGAALPGGVLGALAGIAVCGVWADVMAAGVGGLVGLALAVAAAPDDAGKKGGAKAEKKPPPGAGRVAGAGASVGAVVSASADSVTASGPAPSAASDPSS